MQDFLGDKDKEEDISKNIMFKNTCLHQEIVSINESHVIWSFASNKLSGIDYLRDDFFFDHIAEIYRFCVITLFELSYVQIQENIDINSLDSIHRLIISRLFVTHLRYEIDFLKQHKFF